MKNIIFLDSKTLGNADTSVFAQLGNYKSFQLSSPKEVIERIKPANIIITNKAIVGKEAIDSAPDLELICVAATGLNNIDLDYAKKKNIAVKNVKGYSTDSVAQHTFALMLSMLNSISYFDSYCKSSDGYVTSDMFSNFNREVWELKGKNLGILGLGEIGQRVAEIASIFGANILYYSSSGENRSLLYTRVGLEELMKGSDIISIHAPLNEKTKNLINYDALCMMKKHAILINTGRGGIINEKGLAKALDNNCLSMAALDVFESEPLKAGHPLLSLNNPEKILLTPHIAWASMEARKTLIDGVVKNIREHL